MEGRDNRGFLCLCAYFSATSVSPCGSLGLGCYWVDNSELRKRKRTSLWHLLTLVTLPDFPLHLYHPSLSLNTSNSCSCPVFSTHTCPTAQPPFVCTSRTTVRQLRLPYPGCTWPNSWSLPEVLWAFPPTWKCCQSRCRSMSVRRGSMLDQSKITHSCLIKAKPLCSCCCHEAAAVQRMQRLLFSSTISLFLHHHGVKTT